MKERIQLISAPSILGLKPGGVEKLPEGLLSGGLVEKLNIVDPVVSMPTLNAYYSTLRDPVTHCLNPERIQEFSLDLIRQISSTLDLGFFPLVLGGDCSILIGILPALRERRSYGLIFCDAHADFYEPEKSITGEVADMDLAIVTGRGPALLTNINEQEPYVNDEQVIHIGQRDWEETQKYGAKDIRETTMTCLDYDTIRKAGIHATVDQIIKHVNSKKVEGFWIHFDTDVLSDEENPAVDYRIPGGISFHDYEQLLKAILATNKILGMSITIFNPSLDDENGTIANRLTDLLGQAFSD